MSEELDRWANMLDGGVERRGFLGRLAAAAAALVTSLFGFASTSEGLVVACTCCQLCRPNSGTCSGCNCMWTWNCCVNRRISTCAECYPNFGPCSGSCTGVICSWCRYKNLPGDCG